MARVADGSDEFNRGTNDPQHAARGVKKREITLLDVAKRLGTGRVAGKDDQRAPHGKQLAHGLERELVNDVEGAIAIRGTSIVAKVDIVIVRQAADYVIKNGKSAVA